MQQPPILFLSFANNAHNPLPSLEKESAVIYRLLSPAANQQRIQIHREQYATIDNIAHHLTEFNKRVWLFHYGGHAGSQELSLWDQSANSDGIAYQLAQQKQMKLVFLNGCSTRQQVSLLLGLGIPAVIATSAPVNDTSATEFAESFYKAIAAGHNIKEAFEMAAAVVKTKGGDLPRIHRAFGNPHPETDILPWGLYTKEGVALDDILIPEPKAAGRKKNVLEDTELEADSNVHIGNKLPSEGDYDELNVVKRSKIKTKGDFRLGDG